jgi:hypothetical protein
VEFGSCGECHLLVAKLKACKSTDQQSAIRQQVRSHRDALRIQRQFASNNILSCKQSAGSLMCYCQHDYTLPLIIPSFRPRNSVNLALLVLRRLLLMLHCCYCCFPWGYFTQSLNRSAGFTIRWGCHIDFALSKSFIFFPIQTRFMAVPM